MANFVLVHGAWHGAWCWQRVLPLLTRAGHRAHAVTLSGVGEHARYLSPNINLDTHIADVLAMIEAEELTDIVLVGHSYGGVVITGVADRLLAAQKTNASIALITRATVARMVFVDAVLPLPGESWSSTQSPDTVKARVESAKAHPQQGIAVPPASGFGLSGADADWVNRRQTPQPLGCYLQPLQFDLNAVRQLPRHYIDCNSPASPGIAPSRIRVRDSQFWGGGWQLTELATGHDAMVTEPERLSELIIVA